MITLLSCMLIACACILIAAQKHSIASSHSSHDSPCPLSLPAGAALLSVPYGGIDTVLVMPRGNLEGICPRLLVLAAIAEALDAAAFSTAWELAVTHRCVFGVQGGCLAVQGLDAHICPCYVQSNTL